MISDVRETKMSASMSANSSRPDHTHIPSAQSPRRALDLNQELFLFFLNPNLYTARVLQRYRGGHMLSTYYAHVCVVGGVRQLQLTMGDNLNRHQQDDM